MGSDEPLPPPAGEQTPDPPLPEPVALPELEDPQIQFIIEIVASTLVQSETEATDFPTALAYALTGRPPERPIFLSVVKSCCNCSPAAAAPREIHSPPPSPEAAGPNADFGSQEQWFDMASTLALLEAYHQQISYSPGMLPPMAFEQSDQLPMNAMEAPEAPNAFEADPQDLHKAVMNAPARDRHGEVTTDQDLSGGTEREYYDLAHSFPILPPLPPLPPEHALTKGVRPKLQPKAPMLNQKPLGSIGPEVETGLSPAPKSSKSSERPLKVSKCASVPPASTLPVEKQSQQARSSPPLPPLTPKSTPQLLEARKQLAEPSATASPVGLPEKMSSPKAPVASRGAKYSHSSGRLPQSPPTPKSTPGFLEGRRPSRTVAKEEPREQRARVDTASLCKIANSSPKTTVVPKSPQAPPSTPGLPASNQPKPKALPVALEPMRPSLKALEEKLSMEPRKYSSRGPQARVLSPSAPRPSPELPKSSRPAHAAAKLKPISQVPLLPKALKDIPPRLRPSPKTREGPIVESALAAKSLRALAPKTSPEHNLPATLPNSQPQKLANKPIRGPRVVEASREELVKERGKKGHPAARLEKERVSLRKKTNRIAPAPGIRKAVDVVNKKVIASHKASHRHKVSRKRKKGNESPAKPARVRVKETSARTSTTTSTAATTQTYILSRTFSYVSEITTGSSFVTFRSTTATSVTTELSVSKPIWTSRNPKHEAPRSENLGVGKSPKMRDEPSTID